MPQLIGSAELDSTGLTGKALSSKSSLTLLLCTGSSPLRTASDSISAAVQELSLSIEGLDLLSRETICGAAESFAERKVGTTPIILKGFRMIPETEMWHAIVQCWRIHSPEAHCEDSFNDQEQAAEKGPLGCFGKWYPAQQTCMGDLVPIIDRSLNPSRQILCPPVLTHADSYAVILLSTSANIDLRTTSFLLEHDQIDSPDLGSVERKTLEVGDGWRYVGLEDIEEAWRESKARSYEKVLKNLLGREVNCVGTVLPGGRSERENGPAEPDQECHEIGGRRHLTDVVHTGEIGVPGLEDVADNFAQITNGDSGDIEVPDLKGAADKLAQITNGDSGEIEVPDLKGAADSLAQITSGDSGGRCCCQSIWTTSMRMGKTYMAQDL